MNNLIQQYQSRIIAPSETIRYSDIVKQCYPPQAVHQEPFIGFKAMMTDHGNYNIPGERLRFIESRIGMLRGTGCIIRETASAVKINGYWVITFPTPRSQIDQALTNFTNIITAMENFFNVRADGLFEINVSGKCTPPDVERCLGGLSIPERYSQNLVTPNNSAYRVGVVTRINDQFIVLRTRWNFSNNKGFYKDDLTVISQLVSSIFH